MRLLTEKQERLLQNQSILNSQKQRRFFYEKTGYRNAFGGGADSVITPVRFGG